MSTPLPALEALGLHTHFQPIVDLATGDVVGYEALSRGERGSEHERPDRLLATARVAGRLVEVDSRLRQIAFETATTAGLRAPGTLFVNCEPETATQLGRLGEIWGRDDIPFESVTEITERAVTDDPARLMASVGELRALGWGIALDDMGLDAQAIGLLPFLAPDVVKLDLRLVQQEPTAEVAAAVAALNAYAERSGAVLLAEGIETAGHIAVALALGASLGQGYHFGRPGPLPNDFASPTARMPALAPPVAASPSSAFAVLGSSRPPRRGGEELLGAIADHLERQAGALGPGAIVLSRLDGLLPAPDARLRSLESLARAGAFVGVVGDDVASEPPPGVLGGPLGGDRAAPEWALIVLDSTHATAIAARDPGDSDGYEFVLSHDRGLVTDVARSLMAHLMPD